MAEKTLDERMTMIEGRVSDLWRIVEGESREVRDLVRDLYSDMVAFRRKKGGPPVRELVSCWCGAELKGRQGLATHRRHTGHGEFPPGGIDGASEAADVG